MRLYQKILATGALIASIGLSGCVEMRQKKSPTKILEGIVKEEFGTVQRFVKSSGALFGNESVKIGHPTYGLVLKTDEGKYVISITQTYYPFLHESAIGMTKPVEALAKAIESGDRVRITYDSTTYIGNDRIGRTGSNTVELIEKAK